MLKLAPITLHEANAFIQLHHRHHPRVRGCRAVVGVENGELRGVAVLGRPVSKTVQAEKFTAEVTRLCTDGTKNACSMLYSACARAAAALGYRKVITYILVTEDATSLRASGWHFERITKGGSWDTPSRRRQTKAPTCMKLRWAKDL